jgi:hypothetical protein
LLKGLDKTLAIPYSYGIKVNPPPGRATMDFEDSYEPYEQDDWLNFRDQQLDADRDAGEFDLDPEPCEGFDPFDAFEQECGS